jgi:hypothetical protein
VDPPALLDGACGGEARASLHSRNRAPEKKRGDVKAASAEYRRFLDLWQQADADVPELAEVRGAIARLR